MISGTCLFHLVELGLHFRGEILAQRAADIGQRTRLHDVDIATGLADILDSLEDFLLDWLDFLLLSLLESVTVILLGLLELLVEFVQFSLGLFLLRFVHGALLLLVGIHLGLDFALHAFELSAPNTLRRLWRP